MKENNKFTRQGKTFNINLGLSTGPFLAKDISQVNQKSISLLAAKEVLASQQNTCSLLKEMEKQQHHQATTLKSAHIENVCSRMHLVKNQMDDVERNMIRLRHEKMKLKNSLTEMKDKIQGQNTLLLEENIPYLKRLSKLIKEQHQWQKGVNDESRRELDLLSSFRNKFLDEVIKCETKLLGIQRFLGCSEHHSDS